MKLEIYQSATTYLSAKYMLSKIDSSDFLIDNIIVVPDKYSLLTEKLVLNLSKNKSLFNVRVKTLSSLAVELLAVLGLGQVQILSSGESLLLTQMAIENVKKDFKLFKKSNINFCYEVNKLISQFKSSCVDEEGLNQNAGGQAGAKYHDLALIYKEYQRLMVGALDANERLKLLKNHLAASDILSKTRLYFAHFDAFTKEAIEFINVLFEKADKVAISLAKAESIGNDYIYEKDLIHKFEKIALQHEINLDYFVAPSLSKSHQKAIVNGLYSYEVVKEDNEGYYNVYGGGSLTAEVESVAKLIRYYTYKGYKYSDFQIAVGDLGKYQQTIQQIFDRYDIPCYIDSAITADKTISGNFVVEFLNAFVTGYGQDNLIDLFANILIKNEDLVSICQTYNVEGRGRYQQFLKEVNPFDEEFTLLDKAVKAQDFSLVVTSIINKVADKYNEVLTSLQEEGCLKEYNINLQALEILEESMSLIEQYSSDKIDCGEYLKKLKLLLSFKQVYTVPTYLDSVMVGDATQSGFEEKKFLIVVGGENLPIASADNGLLSDDELVMNGFEKEIEPTIRMINRRNRFKLFNLLSLAEEGLYLFYQLTNSEGKRNELPAYAKSLNAIFSQKPLNVKGVFFTNTPSSEEWAKLVSEPPKEERDYSFLSRENKIKDAKDLVLKGDRVKVTQLESYFSCPFKHFATYGLNLKEFFRDFDPRFLGSVCHKMAELFVKKIIMQGKTCDIKDFVNKHIDIVLESEGAKEKIEYLEEKESLIGFIKKQMIALLKDIVFEKNKSKFTPKYIEVKFSDLKLGKYNLIGKADRIDEFDDYLRIMDYKTGKTGSLLKGLYYGEKLQLFLYQKVANEKYGKKSGGVFYFNAKFNYSKGQEREHILKGLVDKNENLINAIDRDIDHTGRSEITNIYKDSKGYKGSALSEQPIDKLCDYAFKVGERAVSEIEGGYIAPKPNMDACQWCPYGALCQYETKNGVRSNKDEPNF